jgi:hypothetical protein
MAFSAPLGSAAARSLASAVALADVEVGDTSAYVLASRGKDTIKKNTATWEKFVTWLRLKDLAGDEEKYQAMPWEQRLEVRAHALPRFPA